MAQETQELEKNLVGEGGGEVVGNGRFITGLESRKHLMQKYFAYSTQSRIRNTIPPSKNIPVCH